jgi:hypothetical protein
MVTVKKDQPLNLSNTIELNQEKLINGAKKNELIGRLYFYNNNLAIGTVPLYTAEEIINRRNTSIWLKIWQLLKEKIN